MKDPEAKKAQSGYISRRKARRKAFELLFELEIRSSVTMGELLERTFDFEKWYSSAYGHVISDEVNDNGLPLPSSGDDQEDGMVAGEVDAKNAEFIRRICTLVADNVEFLDLVLARYPEEWRFERIGIPEKSILRMALAELLFMDTPVKVAINEALDLTKIYGEHDSNKFINGILSTIVKEIDEIRATYEAHSK